MIIPAKKVRLKMYFFKSSVEDRPVAKAGGGLCARPMESSWPPYFDNVKILVSIEFVYFCITGGIGPSRNSDGPQTIFFRLRA